MCTCKNYLGSVWFKKHVFDSSQVIAYLSIITAVIIYIVKEKSLERKLIHFKSLTSGHTINLLSWESVIDARFHIILNTYKVELYLVYLTYISVRRSIKVYNTHHISRGQYGFSFLNALILEVLFANCDVCLPVKICHVSGCK